MIHQILEWPFCKLRGIYWSNDWPSIHKISCECSSLLKRTRLPASTRMREIVYARINNLNQYRNIDKNFTGLKLGIVFINVITYRECVSSCVSAVQEIILWQDSGGVALKSWPILALLRLRLNEAHLLRSGNELASAALIRLKLQPFLLRQ